MGLIAVAELHWRQNGQSNTREVPTMPNGPPAQRTILPILIRRVNRVRARADGDNTVDELFDDVFVLWRAFEATFTRNGTHSEQTEVAVIEAITYEGVSAVPALLQWALSLKRLEFAPVRELSAWFADSELTAAEAERVRGRLLKLIEAAAWPTRWHDADSRRLARTIYEIRCAVFHSSLETNATTAYDILQALRLGLVDVIVARAARTVREPIQATRTRFDLALQDYLSRDQDN